MFLFIVIVIFIALSAAFIVSLVKRDQGEREPVGALWMAIGLGAVAALAAGKLELLFLKGPLDTAATLQAALTSTLAVGFIEEICKSLPLILIIYKRRYFNEHTDGVIYFALAGMGFGLPENILYTLNFGAATGIQRIILTPLFHAATTAVVGYVLARAKLDHISKWWVVGALAFVGLVHGLYDFGVGTSSLLLRLLAIAITFGFTVNLFVLFTRAKHLDQQQGLSAVGHNTFCRSCGYPNPKHNLYCSHCGNRA